MPGLEQLYIASCGIGFLYIIGTAVLGHFHEGESDMHADGAHGHHATSDHSHDSHDHHDETANRHDLSTTAQQAKIVRLDRDRQNFYFLLLRLFSPLRLSLFLFFFGASGILALQILPALSFISLIPAIVIAVLFTNFLFSAMSAILSRLNSSTNFQDQNLIGTVGELTLSVGPTSTGEITISGKNGRHSGPAKPFKDGQEIKKLSKVIVSDYRDGIFYVEPFEETI